MNPYEKKISEMQSRIDRIRNGQKDIAKKFAEQISFSALCSKSDRQFFESELTKAKKMLREALHEIKGSPTFDYESKLYKRIESFLNPKD